MNTTKRSTMTALVMEPTPIKYVVLGVAVVLLIIAYLWQINTTTSLGVTQEALRQERAVLLEQQKDLQVEVAALQSIVHLKERVATMALHEVQDVDYIVLSGAAAVAINQ